MPARPEAVLAGLMKVQEKIRTEKLDQRPDFKSRPAAIVDRKTPMELSTIANTICERCPGAILKREPAHHDIPRNHGCRAIFL